MIEDNNTPYIIQGGTSVDDRGSLDFINDFDMSVVKRFYSVANHRQGFVRGWHAHKKETKYIFAVAGSALVATVKIDDWDTPDQNLPVDKYVISSKIPSVLCVPGGYAHGYKTLTKHTKLLFFSTSLLSESVNDDYRYDAYYWNAWDILER